MPSSTATCRIVTHSSVLELASNDFPGGNGHGVTRIRSDALVNVIQGIKEAQKLEGIGGYVAPEGIGSHQFPANTGVVNNQRITSTVMQFDVAVTAERSKGGGAETGVRIAVVEAKIGGKVQLKDIQVSRVQFSVPIILPKNLRNWASEADAVPDRHK